MDWVSPTPFVPQRVSFVSAAQAGAEPHAAIVQIATAKHTSTSNNFFIVIPPEFFLSDFSHLKHFHINT
jgi:hypothetical protein